jgi:hypothetical protein
MTPRDHYAAAALQGIISTAPSGGLLEPEAISLSAIEIAERMAVEACKRWGHDLSTVGESCHCSRCGELNVVVCDICGRPKGSGATARVNGVTTETCGCIPF